MMDFFTISFLTSFGRNALSIGLFIQATWPACPMEMFMSLKILNPSQYLSQLLVDICYSISIIVTTVSTITIDTKTTTVTTSTTTDTDCFEFSGLHQVKIISAFLNIIFSTIDTTSSYSRPDRISTTCLTTFAPFRPFIRITTLAIFWCLLFQLIAASGTSWLKDIYRPISKHVSSI